MDVELSPENRERLAVMVALHRHWTAAAEARAAAAQARVAVLLWAASVVEEGTLPVAQVCLALQISQNTWYRHMRALRPVRGSETERLAVAAIDQALREAGADETTTIEDVKANPDLELALATIGVHHRITETETP
jgi:hypothetical protein